MTVLGLLVKDFYTQKSPVWMNKQQMKPKSSERENSPLRDVSLNSYHEPSENSCNSWNEGLSTSRDPGAGERCSSQQPPVPELCGQLSPSVCDSGQGTSDIQKEQLARPRKYPCYLSAPITIFALEFAPPQSFADGCTTTQCSPCLRGRHWEAKPSHTFPWASLTGHGVPKRGEILQPALTAAVLDTLVKILGVGELNDQ